MHVEVLGGGPAGLTLAILLKRHDPACRVRVVERGPRNSTVVFEFLGLLLLRSPGWHTPTIQVIRSSVR